MAKVEQFVVVDPKDGYTPDLPHFDACRAAVRTLVHDVRADVESGAELGEGEAAALLRCRNWRERIESDILPPLTNLLTELRAGNGGADGDVTYATNVSLASLMPIAADPLVKKLAELRASVDRTTAQDAWQTCHTLRAMTEKFRNTVMTALYETEMAAVTALIDD